MELKDLVKKKSFEISMKDAIRLVDSLEFTADFDKTDIYYKLHEWIREVKNDQT